MKLSTFSVIWTVLYGTFGLGLLTIPALFMSQYGVTLNDSGVLMSRILGSALFAYAIIFYLNRNIPIAEKTQYNILLGSIIYNVLDTPIVLMAVLHGTMNAMGYVPIVLHLFLASTMAYFVVKS